MPTYYLDLVSGNDSNTGLSWAQAWRTFANGPTAARIAPGDEIRVAKSPDPTSVGTATWTSGKVGNSITFSSAPTKVIDNCKAGWVTMGAGSTVTNGQSTAYITPVTWGGTTVGALQWVTSASANGAYKDLGSTIDYSGYQQVCFWFRSTSALDCTGAQNLLVDLCSDASATTVVSALTAPKWNYAANMWYPIVIDLGSALSSTVRSVRIRTTNATTQTFYIDEMFASPASGLTLWSLIGKHTSTPAEQNDWYPIKTIRDADVQLFAAYSPGTAAAGNTAAVQVDCAWVGTTETVTTYKRETYKAYGTSGPAAITGISFNESATATSPNRLLGGWDTGTNTQDGVTFIDNLTHVSTAVGINTTNAASWQVDMFGLIRWTSNSLTGAAAVYTNLSVIGNGSFTMSTNSTVGRDVLNALGITGYSWSCFHSNVGSTTFHFGNTTASTNTIGNMWGAVTSPSIAALQGSTLNIGNVGVAMSTSGNFWTFSPAVGSTINIGKFTCLPTANTGTACGLFSNSQITASTITFDDVNMGTINSAASAGPGTVGDSVIYMKSYTAPGNCTLLGVPGIYANFTLHIPSYSGGNLVSVTTAGNPGTNSKVYFHNFNGPGYFRAYVLDPNSGTNVTSGYFDLDGVDVYTPGSKAVRIVAGSGGYTVATNLGTRLDLKLGSAAAEANKLVTVTCRVKRNTTAMDAGIYVPGVGRLLPGYTTDQSTQCSSTSTWELLTLTFTPTEACVFDVMAWYKMTSTGSPSASWDALTITQAP